MNLERLIAKAEAHRQIASEVRLVSSPRRSVTIRSTDT